MYFHFYLKGKEMVRELPSVGLIPQITCNSQGWARPQPRGRNSSWVSHAGERDKSTWAMVCCLKRHALAGSQMGSGAGIQPGILIGDAGVLSRISTAEPNDLSSFPFLIFLPLHDFSASAPTGDSLSCSLSLVRFSEMKSDGLTHIFT